MAGFARMFDAGLVASIDEWVLRLHDPARLAPLPIVRPGVARHAGDRLLVLELHATSTLALSAPCDGIVRRVALDPATPLPAGAGSQMLEVVPAPFKAPPALGGTLTFYLAPFDAAPADGEQVARGALLATSAPRAWIAARFQDSFAAAAWDWMRAITAQLPTVEQADWAGQESVFATRERLRICDHVGSPLEGATFSIMLRRNIDLAIEEQWSVTLDARSDLSRSLADAPLTGASGSFASLYAPPVGRHFALRWISAAGPRGLSSAVLSQYPDGPATAPDQIFTLAPGAPLRRSLQALAIEDWFAPEPAGSAVPMFRAGSRVEPLVDGTVTFQRLARDLDDARRGQDVGQKLGAHFGGLLVRDFALVPGRDDTRLSIYARDILAANGEVLAMPSKFVNLRDEDIPAVRQAAILLLFALSNVVLFEIVMKAMPTDERGAIFLFLAIVGIGIVLAELELPIEEFEISQSLIDTLNAGREVPIAIYTRPPMTIDDNPLTPPTKLYSLESQINQFGFWHGKTQTVKRAADGDAESHVAYVGGIDISPNRLDTPQHQGRGPYHDVQARVTGPAAADLFTSFAERWDRESGLQTPAPAALTIRPDANALAESPSRHVARIGRTYYGARPGEPSPLADFASGGERTIYETLLRAIRSARDHIYIEDQYFTPNNEYLDALVAAAAHCRRLVVLIPTESDQVFGERRRRMIVDRLRGSPVAPAWGDRFFIGSPYRRPLLAAAGPVTGTGRCTLAREVGSADDALFITPPSRVPKVPAWLWVEGELMLARVAENTTVGNQPAKRVTVIREAAGSLVLGTRARAHQSGAPVTFSQLKGIYVHAKCMMVDDIFVSIGSANTNRRGFFHDGEINVFAIPEALRAAPDNPARALRTALWAEQLALPPTMAPLLADATSAFDLFLRSRFFTRAAPITAHDIRPELPVNDFDLIPGSIAQVLIAQAGMIGISTLEQLLDDIWNVVIDPTSFSDPNPQPGPL